MTVRVATSPPEELPMPEEPRGNQAVWMVRLGEFFQRRVNQAAAAVAPVLERPSRSALTRSFMTPPSSWNATSPRTQQAPLFTPEAERTMQQWPQQAPLLHGQGGTSAGQRDAESSSGSLTQDQVLAEVRRQVQVAMQAHTRELESLKQENEYLRAGAARNEGVFARPPAAPLFLRGGNPAGPPGEGDHREDGARGDVHVGLPRGPSGAGGNDGGVCEGGVVMGPPPGLTDDGKSGLSVSYHEPRSDRGGDQGGLQGGPGVLGGQPCGGGQDLLQGREAQAKASMRPSGSSAPVEMNTRASRGDEPRVASGATTEPVNAKGGIEPSVIRPGPATRERTTTTAPAADPPAASTRSTADPFDLLAKGMAQLQSAMAASMTSKSAEPEHVKPGISELPRLPELSETSCIDVGDWLHALQCPMGDLSNSSAAWWKVLLCLDRFYDAYLKSSNLTKLSFRPESFASAAIKEDKWSRVDKRATSMLLASLPESVRTEILASRLTGALQVLGRVMVLYRPGSTAERQQIFKALETPAEAANAGEAVYALRRWSRWLHRAGDVGLQRPDPSILLRGLDGIVKKVIKEHIEILFRINMTRYTLEVDVKPSQQAVEDLHRALLSEFEQVAFRGRDKTTEQPTLRTVTMTPTASAASSGNGESNGGDSSPGKGKIGSM
eukprot:s83_g2.t1